MFSFFSHYRLLFYILFPVGVCEVEEGEVNGQEIKLESRALGRMSFGKEPAVTKVRCSTKKS